MVFSEGCLSFSTYSRHYNVLRARHTSLKLPAAFLAKFNLATGMSSTFTATRYCRMIEVTKR